MSENEMTELKLRREMMRRPKMSVDAVSALTGVDLQVLKEAEEGLSPLYSSEQAVLAAFLGAPVNALFNRAGYSHVVARRASSL